MGFIVTLNGVAQELWDRPKDKHFADGPIMGDTNETAPKVTVFPTAAEAYAAIGRTVCRTIEGRTADVVVRSDFAFRVVPLAVPA